MASVLTSKIRTARSLSQAEAAGRDPMTSRDRGAKPPLISDESFRHRTRNYTERSLIVFGGTVGSSRKYGELKTTDRLRSARYTEIRTLGSKRS